MALMSWNPELSVGVAEIDAQHRKLIDLINILHDGMKAGKGRDVMGGILKELIDYTGYHFSTEEKYFDMFGYPESEVHKSEHRRLVKKVLEFKGRFDGGEVGVSMELMAFLTDWLINHIRGTDKRYGPFFNQHGLK